jgi:hypothetical protein
MSAGIYLLPTLDSKLSQDRDFINPFSLTFDGRQGGIKQTRLYLRNDDALVYYTNLTVKVQDIGIEPIINRPNDGFVWKLSAGDIQPTLNDWANLAPANTISLPDLGDLGSPDISTFLPFWVFVQTPQNLNVQTFDTVSFLVQGEENLV